MIELQRCLLTTLLRLSKDIVFTATNKSIVSVFPSHRWYLEFTINCIAKSLLIPWRYDETRIPHCFISSAIKIYTDHKNLTCKNFNTDRVLRWSLILEEYGPDIKYIPDRKKKSAGELSRLTNNGNQEITHESTYLTEKKFRTRRHRRTSKGHIYSIFQTHIHLSAGRPHINEKKKVQNILRVLFVETGIL